MDLIEFLSFKEKVLLQTQQNFWDCQNTTKKSSAIEQRGKKTF